MDVLAYIAPGALIVVAGLVMFWIDAKLSDNPGWKRRRRL
jgi:hypothetical protein